jgi:GT2 family glycosyltransferase
MERACEESRELRGWRTQARDKLPIAERPRVAGKFLFQGNAKFYVKGVSYGAFRPDAAKREYQNAVQIDYDFGQMAKAGVNTVRIPHTVPPISLLDTALRHKLRVMVGLSAEQYIGYLLDPLKQRPNIKTRIRRKVQEIKEHPALLCYSIGNEITAPVARMLGRKTVERYLWGLYDVIKAEDPSGIVTYVNYPSTEYLQLPFLDIVCFNVYLESANRLQKYVGRLHNVAEDRPLIMSEIGLDAFRNGEMKQAETLDWQVRSCFASGCAGVVVFSWTDEWHRGGAEVEDWAFGITDRRRRPKPALNAVQKAFAETPFPPDNEWPRFSIVVCSYNGSRTIRKTLDGIGRLEYPNFEIIVIDDGSTDATAAIAASYNCRLISTKNAGLSSARNVGLRAASGEIIAYLDDDAVPDSNWLHYLAASFRKTKHAAIGGPNIAPSDENIVADCVDKAPGCPTHVLLTDELAEHIPGCNMAVRKSCLEAVGGFDPVFRSAGDDVDLCWRLQQNGWTLGFSPGAMVWHHRRHSLFGYLKQQRGYGIAEALLERKWPEKYNAAGHYTFSGRLYGRGTIRTFFRRSVIYHGRGGFAPFQSLYERSSGVLGTLSLVPEWYLLIFALIGLTALGISWTPMLLAAIPAVAAVNLSVAYAVVSGVGSFSYTESHSALVKTQRQALTTLLYLLQPLARLCGRLQSGLTAWRRRGPPGFAFPRSRSFTRFSEHWEAPEERLAKIERALRANGAIVLSGSGFDRWDMQVIGGTFGSARMVMAIEDQGSGMQFIRVRSWPRCRLGGRIIISVFGVLSLLAAIEDAWLATAVLGSVTLWAMWGVFQQAAQATACLLRAIRTTMETR